MRSLSTNIYTFEKLIVNNCLYIDKTYDLHKLVTVPSGQFFFARPRRFGKSLMLSTLKAIFEGRKDLFEGLYIAGTDYDWEAFPVILLNLGSAAGGTAEDLDRKLRDRIVKSAENHGITNLPTGDAADAFLSLVEKLADKKGKVVVLVDEYDKPILGNAGNKEELSKILALLKSFYSVIKTTEPYQRFAMITGVSKFSRVSIFSDLNNLTDITMSAEYATMLGYTQEELEENFDGYIEKVGNKHRISREKMLDAMRDWYNGYRFEEDAVTVYNPVSVMKFFDSAKFNNYWFETGTPRLLIDLLKEGMLDVPAVESMVLDSLGFSAYEIEDMAPEPLLFQTGYVTIKGYDPASNLYTLGYPNREVRDAFIRYLAGSFTGVRKEKAVPEAYQLKQLLSNHDIDGFMERLKPFFAEIEYDLHISQEKYYQTVFYLIVKLMGIYVNTEVKTNIGRIDAVIEVSDRIYIFEFKLDGTAEEALKQIHENHYFERYLSKNKEIILIGANFDTEARNVERWLIDKAEEMK